MCARGGHANDISTTTTPRHIPSRATQRVVAPHQHSLRQDWREHHHHPFRASMPRLADKSRPRGWSHLRMGRVCAAQGLGDLHGTVCKPRTRGMKLTRHATETTDIHSPFKLTPTHPPAECNTTKKPCADNYRRRLPGHAKRPGKGGEPSVIHSRKRPCSCCQRHLQSTQ